MSVSSWIRFDGCGQYIDVHPETGKWTYGGAIPYCRCDNPEDFNVNVGLGESCGNRTISFEGKNFDGCNDEWLVTWFNYGSNTAYTILNDSSIFEVKNVDDCKRVITTKNNSIYPLLYNQDEIFVHSSYTDCGVPKLIDSPLTAICKTKYSTTQQNSGHKVKYKPINSRIPSGCITDNNYLTEIYFPSYLDDTNYKNTRTIGAGAFTNNNRLSAITLGVVSRIEENAFVNCKDLSLIDWGHCSQNDEDNTHISSVLNYIGDTAFRNCNSLNYINLPNTLKEIGAYAFHRTMLNTTESCLYIPTSLDIIKEHAFNEINPKCIVWNISDYGLLKDGLLPKNGDSDYNPVFSFYASPIYVYLPNLKTESSFNIINRIIDGSFPGGSKIYVGMSDEDIQNLPSGEHYFGSNTTVLNKSHWTEDGFSTSWPYDNPS